MILGVHVQTGRGRNAATFLRIPEAADGTNSTRLRHLDRRLAAGTGRPTSHMPSKAR